MTRTSPVSSPLSPELQERLRLGKYTRWAESLSEEELFLVLWHVGEFGLRAPELFGDEHGRAMAEVQRTDEAQSTAPFPYAGRRAGALRVLAQFVRGRRPSKEQCREILLRGSDE